MTKKKLPNPIDRHIPFFDGYVKAGRTASPKEFIY